MRKLIAGSWSAGTFEENKFARAILLFRNTPKSGGASPAQVVLKRPMRDTLPVHHRAFVPEWQLAADVLEKREERAKELSVKNFNRHAHTLPAFAVEDHVVAQHPVTKRWKTPRIVVEIGPNRDYLVKSSAGRICRRNRRLLRRRVPVMPGNISSGH